MIFDMILSVLATLIGGIFTLIFALIPTPPSGVVTAIADGMEFVDDLHSMDTWIPVDLCLTLIGLVLAAYVASVMIGIVRLIVSYFTLGSGAT